MFFIWEKTKEISFIIGLLLIFAYTVIGGWFITIDLLTNNFLQQFGLNYYYLFDKMFPVNLDGDLIASIIFYSSFVIIVEIFILLFAKKRKETQNDTFNQYYLSHTFIIILALVSTLGSIAIMSSFIIESFSTGTSAYLLTRTGDTRIPFYTIHQLLIRMALFPLAIGIVTYINGKNGKYLMGNSTRKTLAGYIIIVLSIILYAAILGNRNELVGAAIVGFLFYIANTKELKPKRFVLTVIIGLAIIGTIGIIRGSSFTEILEKLSAKTFLEGLLSALTSNEMFAAYLSMYGTLHFSIPIIWGYSIFSLAASIIPRDIWPERPLDIYFHYFDHINAVPGQGYVIHHATGWYLNFSVIGIIIGAILLVFIWLKCYNRFSNLTIRKSHIANIFTILSPWLFVSGIPALIRSGPEAYKALIIEHLLIPTFIITIATGKIKYTPISGNHTIVSNETISRDLPAN